MVSKVPVPLDEFNKKSSMINGISVYIRGKLTKKVIRPLYSQE